MTTMVWTYILYLTICISITAWVARTLRHFGVLFVTSGTEASKELANAHAHLLIVGFYLLCIGAISFALRFGGRADNPTTAIELLSTKVGGMVILIGAMHFSMMAVLARLRRTSVLLPHPTTYAVATQVRE